MNVGEDKQKTPYQELREDLDERWSEVAVRIRELEGRIEAGLDLDGAADADVRELVRYSRLMRRHMAEVQAHADTLLEQIAADPNLDYLEGAAPPRSSEASTAMLEIQGEMHRPSDSFLEVLKAVFMWRDSPEERIERGDPGRKGPAGE
jgi:hypothetical protein